MGYVATERNSTGYCSDEEITALYGMLVSLGATKMMAQKLMRDFPDYRAIGAAISDLAADGESDIRAALDKLSDDSPRHRDRGGATA